MIVIFASVCLYLACLCLYHAHARRTAFGFVKANPKAPMMLRWGAAVLSALSLVLLVNLKGIEKGFSIWVGIFVAAGILSLLIMALRPGDHVRSGYVAASGGVIALIVAGLGA